MSARQAQIGLAAVFLILGGWCLILPATVLDLAFRPDYRSEAPLVPILIACFGAQAMLAGLFAAFAIFTRRTFAVLALALLPFFAFDYWFTFVQPMLTPIGAIDAVGNLAMLGLCWIGWRRAEP